MRVAFGEPNPRLPHLNDEIFYSLKEVKTVIMQCRKYYNTTRPHSSLRYRPPAPQASNPFAISLERAPPMQ